MATGRSRCRSRLLWTAEGASPEGCAAMETGQGQRARPREAARPQGFFFVLWLHDRCVGAQGELYGASGPRSRMDDWAPARGPSGALRLRALEQRNRNGAVAAKTQSKQRV